MREKNVLIIWNPLERDSTVDSFASFSTLKRANLNDIVYDIGLIKTLGRLRRRC